MNASLVTPGGGDPRSWLLAGAEALGIGLDGQQTDRLLQYLGLLQHWNRAFNLTAVRDPQAMVVQHLLDCLAVVPPLMNRRPGPLRVLDVGSGGGLPGVVLAVMQPGWHVNCVDAVGKKAAFVQQVAGALALPNLVGIHRRVEALPGSFDLVTARAFASLSDLVRLSAARLAPGGCWMAMKGQHPQAELAELAHSGLGAEVFHVEPLLVPGLNAERCLVWMRPQEARSVG